MYNQDYKTYPVRSAAILTTSYVAGTVIEQVHLQNQLIVLVDFTIGSLTTAEIKIEFSPDNTTFYQEAFTAISGGTSTETLGAHQIGATGKYRLAIPIKDRFIKISVKGTGTTTSSSMTVDAIIGVE